MSVLANKLVKSSLGKNIHFLLTAALLLTILQIVFGTQVRQQIDVINLDSGADARNLDFEIKPYLFSAPAYRDGSSFFEWVFIF